jgi:hypothetical protein
MSTKLLLPLTLALFLISSCSHTISTEQALKLSADASAIFNNPGFIDEISSKDWPVSISSLNPERVYIKADGVYIVLSTSYVEEDGIFISKSQNFESESGSDPSYTLISGNVFKYHISG